VKGEECGKGNTDVEAGGTVVDLLVLVYFQESLQLLKHSFSSIGFVEE
jgi:hypothetical protein